ncbi:hypothetical protein [Tautonia plasticadhaerens]|uniref:Glycoside hydrolase family 42 N-terminal domain-containing protein n=1 Tax=Tautonia plasticadhaerens TaxID=2527974 RepID=A0A518GV84_9BACT|nr:hypothetical protein [Tautonia plasticadhaerens]QDV32493.1 hypothetical protein ElP_03260 [Tautonia plasticadhaerens]
MTRRALALALLLLPSATTASRAEEPFPIAVWLQSPDNAGRYREIGINTYVALYRGPTEEQLDKLDEAGMKAIVGQSERSLRFKDRPTITAWMHDDEPDNAQSLPDGEGYGPPVPPASIVEDYRAMKQADPTRPVLLNLGQGVAWDGWVGRGVRTNHPEDYPEYLEGCDIASFDIYPACHDREAVAGNLWYVPRGVDRLVSWTRDEKPVWCCIETTRISNPDHTPDPLDVRAEAWMALIHGADGLIYFCHQFEPRFIEAGLLAEPAIAREVASINRRIQELAPVLRSPDRPDLARVESSDEGVPVDSAVRRLDGVTYVLSVAMRDGETTATYRIPDLGDALVEVLGEDRTIEAPGGSWQDRFEGYGVHLYRITPASGR